jgi:zinc protease
MLHRKKGPAITRPHSLQIPAFRQYSLDNGMQVCEIDMGSQDIFKMEIVHRAGRSAERQALTSRAVSSLLKEGCAGMSSKKVAEKIDYYGASIKTGANMDFAYTTFYSLTSHATELIPLIRDMYYAPDFRQEEIDRFISVNVEKLREELTKNDVISYRQITEEIFGAMHPYGYNSTENDYQNLCREVIVHHHEEFFGSDNAFLFLSGKLTDAIRDEMQSCFGTITKITPDVRKPVSEMPLHGRSIRIHSRKEHQSAIKTGRLLFDKNHPDNPGFFVLNTILGGYFGSRLMASIREEKGFTYDIFSSMDQMLYDGCFYISTEAATEYVEPLLAELYHQMSILQHEAVGPDELQMVKNYLMGNFMNMLDGPMNLGSFAKSLFSTGQTQEDFLTFVDKMLAITDKDLLLLAQKYLNKEDMIEVVVTPS